MSSTAAPIAWNAERVRLDGLHAVLGALGTVGDDADDLLGLDLDLGDQPGDLTRGGLR